VKLPPILHWMPRVDRDIEKCLDFVGGQPWGKPDDRELDIWRAIEMAHLFPEAARAEFWRPESGLWLRRRNAAQFVVVYAYLPSSGEHLPAVVSIRAVRHSRVEDVFSGVKEPLATYTALQTDPTNGIDIRDSRIDCGNTD
jgi:hypothetical protein